MKACEKINACKFDHLHYNRLDYYISIIEEAALYEAKCSDIIGNFPRL